MALLYDIPKFGFGTAFDVGQQAGDKDKTNDRNKTSEKEKMSEEEFKALLRAALELDVRHFDCAPLYGTQKLVGEVLNEQMKTIDRNRLFVTSKLPVNMMREENIEKSLKKTLNELQLTYLDLFLIHAPFSTQYVTDDEIYPLDAEGNLLLDEEDGVLEKAWMKMSELKKSGLVRFIGISNVNLEQIIRLHALHPIDVVQNEYHLFKQDHELFDYCEENDIHFQAYAGFGCPAKAKSEGKPSFMTDSTVRRIAKDNNISNAQVIIKWLNQQPLSYIIRSDSRSQLEDNLKAMRSFNLSINDLIDLDSLNRNLRLFKFDNYKGITRHKEYPFKKSSEPKTKEPLSEQKDANEDKAKTKPNKIPPQYSVMVMRLKSHEPAAK